MHHPTEVTAVLSHQMLHSVGRKTVLASQTLTSTEQESTSEFCHRSSKKVIFIKLSIQNQKLKCVDVLCSLPEPLTCKKNEMTKTVIQ